LCHRRNTKDTTIYKDLQVDRGVYTIHGVLGIPSKGISNTPPETCKLVPVKREGKIVTRVENTREK
jgi:hypothetical protein